MSTDVGPVASRGFHVMAKPTGAVCNLDCAYCFYLTKERLYPGSDFRMSAEVLERYVGQLLAAGEVPDHDRVGKMPRRHDPFSIGQEGNMISPDPQAVDRFSALQVPYDQSPVFGIPRGRVRHGGEHAAIGRE